MSITATLITAPPPAHTGTPSPASASPSAPPRPTTSSSPPTTSSSPSAPLPPSAPTPRHRCGRGGRVIFEVPFKSEMNDADLALLARLLDLSTHMQQKLRPDPNSPGVARLDHFSGLFLRRGPAEGDWVLEGRTWGSPAAETVHAWQLLAAFAARQLDPAARTPERSLDASGEPERAPLPRCCQGWIAEQSHGWHRHR